MKLHSIFKHPDGWYFIIQDGGSAGSYLYVYEGPEGYNLDLKSRSLCSYHQQDHLQDTPYLAKEQALEDFGVPLESWEEADS